MDEYAAIFRPISLKGVVLGVRPHYYVLSSVTNWLQCCYSTY